MNSPHTGLSPAQAGLSRPFCSLIHNHWPVPLSLATTDGISVDVFSSRYLDVSVPRVRLTTLCIQIVIPIAGWVSPFGYPWINACSRLPMAFRSVPRPSSPPGAKASTERPSHAHTTRMRINPHSHLHRNHPTGVATRGPIPIQMPPLLQDCEKQSSIPRRTRHQAHHSLTLLNNRTAGIQRLLSPPVRHAAKYAQMTHQTLIHN